MLKSGPDPTASNRQAHILNPNLCVGRIHLDVRKKKNLLRGQGRELGWDEGVSLNEQHLRSQPCTSASLHHDSLSRNMALKTEP